MRRIAEQALKQTEEGDTFSFPGELVFPAPQVSGEGSSTIIEEVIRPELVIEVGPTEESKDG